MTNAINGYQIYQAFVSGYLNMAKQREKMNRINVFPVKDGDTGSNMVGTMKLIVSDLKSCRSAGEMLDRIARISLVGARGNSGLILSQYLNGLANSGRGKKEITLADWADMVQSSVEEAYGAVESPREGTLLTVMKVWAGEIQTFVSSDLSPCQIMSRSLSTAQRALKATQNQLDVLRNNHVVDAGALGFVSFLEGVSQLGDRGRITFEQRNSLKEEAEKISFGEVVNHPHLKGTAPSRRYCTEVLIEGEGLNRDELMEQLQPWGDSLVITCGQNRTRVHIHTNYPAQVVGELRSRGKLIEQKADDMVRQEEALSSPLGKIALLTDSVADITPSLLDKYQIHRIHHSLVWDDEEYLDRLTLNSEIFYQMQKERRSVPTSTNRGLDKLEKQIAFLLGHYEGVIILPVAKGLSGTWQRLALTVEKFNIEEKRVSLVDTRLNSVAQGLLVKRIGEEAAQGKNLDELTAMAEELRERIKIYVSVKTFKYMIRGGRMSPLKGTLARLLHLKPVVSLDSSGKGIALDKAFTSRGLLRKIGKILDEKERGPGIEEYALVHASDKERGDLFLGMVRKVLKREPAYISDISAIVGMNAGQGTVAVGIVEKKC
jgi:uncharacterized protein